MVERGGAIRRAAGSALILGLAVTLTLASVALCRAPVTVLVTALVSPPGQGAGAVRPDLLLAGCAAAVLPLCATWFLLVAVVGALDACGSAAHVQGRWMRRLAPTTVRRLVALACGTALGSAAVVGPVAAETGAQPLRSVHEASHHTSLQTPLPAAPADPPADPLQGLRLPDRPLTAAGPAARSGTMSPARPGALSSARPASRTAAPTTAPGAARPTQTGPQVVIRPGDSLWRIAARLLPAYADREDVDRGWRTVYRANRAALGPDPDLIHPGDVLDVTALTHHRKDAR